MQKYMPSSQFNCYLIIITITIVDRKSTRLNSSHLGISYAVFCLKKKSTRLNSSHLGISYAVFCLEKKREYVLGIDEPSRLTQHASLLARHNCATVASDHDAAHE